MSPTSSGSSTILGRLAEHYRLGGFGAAQPGTAAGARSHLRTPEAIIEALRAARQLPTAEEGERWSWSYLCRWYDRETGEQVGRGVAWTVETPAGTDYRTAAAEARRRTLYPSSEGESRPPTTAAGVRLECRRLGQPIVLPTQ